jgi:hypothetical protein
VFHREEGTPLLPTSVNHQDSNVRTDMQLPDEFTRSASATPSGPGSASPEPKRSL